MAVITGSMTHSSKNFGVFILTKKFLQGGLQKKTVHILKQKKKKTYNKMSVSSTANKGEKMSLDFYLQYEIDDNEIEVFDANITHNLNEMAKQVGIYEALWHHTRINAVYAKDIIGKLDSGYNQLVADPAKYKKFDSPNGWGKYDNFVPFVKKVLDACEKYPNAKIKTDI